MTFKSLPNGAIAKFFNKKEVFVVSVLRGFAAQTLTTSLNSK
jgi:hypothetical protein